MKQEKSTAWKQQMIELLEQAYEAGFTEGFYCEDSPGEAKEMDDFIEELLASYPD